MARFTPEEIEAKYSKYIGKRVGKVVITAICKFERPGKNGKTRKGSRFSGLCDCGNETTIPFERVVMDCKSTCGCDRNYGRKPRLVHGESKTKLHRVWRGMVDRCRDAEGHNQNRHGARGIRVCEEWSDYVTFRNWALSNGYQEGLQIDRQDNNGHYCPNNCHWTTVKINSNNRRDTVYLEYQGERTPLSLLADKFGITGRVLRKRLKVGWPLEKALNTPIRKQ